MDQSVSYLPGLAFYDSYTHLSFVTSCVKKSLDVSDICTTGCSACKEDPCTFTVQNSKDGSSEQVACSSNGTLNAPAQVSQCYVGNWTFPIDYYLDLQSLDSLYTYCTVMYFFFEFCREFYSTLSTIYFKTKYSNYKVGSKGF